MLNKVKMVVVLGVVAAAAMVPLFGDPRTTPVTHPLWARMLLRALEQNDAVRTSRQASQVFSTLAFKDSLSYPADAFLKSDGVAVREEGGRKEITVASGVGEAVYPLSVVQGGDYRMRVRMSGPATSTATAEIAPLGGSPLKSFALVPAAASSWVSSGTTHLDPGAYSASFMLPAGTSLEQIEVAPPCVSPIEPPGGWKPTAIVGVDDVAVTALRAMDLESELPPGAAPLEMSGGQFAPEDPTALRNASAAEGLEGVWLRAGARGVRAIATLEVPEAGLYTLSAFGIPGSGQAWVADGCRKVVICPSTKGAAWRAVMTQAFSAGRHSVAVTLLDGAGVERLRLEKKKQTPADYLAALRRLGFDPGPDGPVTRDKALDAMKFVQRRREDLATTFCGDVRLPTSALPPAQLATAAQSGAASATTNTTTTGAVNPPVPPLGSALLPPQQPASPTQPGP
jgi:hypothetical protein